MVNDAPDLHPNDLNAATIAFAISGVSRPSFLLGDRFFCIGRRFYLSDGMGGRSRTLEPMKILATQMPDLKLRLLDRIVQRNRMQVSATLSQEKTESYKMTVCKAVEDRICERIDLATRTDLTARQAIDALRLLLNVLLGWPVGEYLAQHLVELRYAVLHEISAL